MAVTYAGYAIRETVGRGRARSRPSRSVAVGSLPVPLRPNAARISDPTRGRIGDAIPGCIRINARGAAEQMMLAHSEQLEQRLAAAEALLETVPHRWG